MSERRYTVTDRALLAMRANAAKGRAAFLAQYTGKPHPRGPWGQLDLELDLLWAQGEPASAIAENLSRLCPGITRDAVIGRAHRLKLPARPSPIKRAA